MTLRMMSVRVALLAGVAALLLVGAARVGAGGNETATLCVERPISFNPLFRPSGCFTYEPIEGGFVVIGRALLDAQFLASGGTVEARVGDTTCGSTVIERPDGLFVLPIVDADSQAGCATAGVRLSFYLDSEQTQQTLAWPDGPTTNPEFLSLSAVNDAAWYWFERATEQPARPGTVVQAYTNGIVCGDAVVGDEDDALGVRVRPNMRGFLRLIVPAEGDRCGQDGALVEFRVDGLRAVTEVPWSAGVHRLDLLVQGDANCDFLVDSRDASFTLQVSAALIESVRCHGDADRDGDIDVFDARHILEFAAGLTNELPL